MFYRREREPGWVPSLFCLSKPVRSDLDYLTSFFYVILATIGN